MLGRRRNIRLITGMREYYKLENKPCGHGRGEAIPRHCDFINNWTRRVLLSIKHVHRLHVADYLPHKRRFGVHVIFREREVHLVYQHIMSYLPRTICSPNKRRYKSSSSFLIDSNRVRKSRLSMNKAI